MIIITIVFIENKAFRNFHTVQHKKSNSGDLLWDLMRVLYNKIS